MLASVSLLAPYGLLACLLALVPLAVVALAFRRQRRVSRALGLEPVPGRRAIRAAAWPAVACLMLGVAVAEPAITTTTERSARTSSEVVFVDRRLTVDDGGVRPRRAHPTRSCTVGRRGATPVRSRCPGRAHRSYRPGLAVRVPDARPADIRRDAGGQRAGGVAATAGDLGRRHELRAALRTQP